MFKRWKLLACVAALASLGAGAQSVNGITLDTSVRFEFTNCAAGGSAAQSLTKGSYLFRVTTEDTWICYAATCAAGGEKFAAGTAFLLSVPATTSISCRSAASTGDAIFTKALFP